MDFNLAGSLCNRFKAYYPPPPPRHNYVTLMQIMVGTVAVACHII